MVLDLPVLNEALPAGSAAEKAHRLLQPKKKETLELVQQTFRHH